MQCLKYEPSALHPIANITFMHLQISNYGFILQSDTNFTHQKLSPCSEQQTQYAGITVSVIQLQSVPRTLQRRQHL
jgi:hypothetical protein